MRVIVSGGGTGGHIYPALAIAERILTELPGSEVLYLGCENGLENSIVPRSGLPFKTISAKGLPRKVSPELFKAVAVSAKGLADARRHIREFGPDLVIGTGGFVCGPTVLMATLEHVHTLIHEQNAYPGLTNRILSSRVDTVMITYPEARDYFTRAKEVALTGLPVRSDIDRYSHEEGCAAFGLDPDKKTILVTGGSRGARTINRVVALALPSILSEENAQVIFVTGKTGYSDTGLLLKESTISPDAEARLRLLDYTHDMQHALAAADVVIGRAGATFLAEIAACDVPGILVPYPYASENHQEHNAQSVVDAGGAEMILDDEMTVPRLLEVLTPFLRDKDYYAAKKNGMRALARPNALDDIMALVNKYR